MSALSTRPGPAPSAGEDGRLQAVAEELRRRGCDARITVHRFAGDRDVRLEVSGAGAVDAELLDTWGDAPCGDRWQAVRSAPDGRVVWCGPPRRCPVDTVATFVQDLLRYGEPELHGRHVRLG